MTDNFAGTGCAGCIPGLENAMAEETVAEAPKKKNNKMSVIIVCVVMLFTGGFFGIKMRGGGKTEQGAIKLDKTIDLDEFLVNLTDQKTFLRTKISIQAREKLPKEAVDNHLAAIKDKIINILASQGVDKISLIETKKKLKSEIAAAINKELDLDEEVKKLEGGKAEADWDSSNGPVFRVFFTTFAFQ